MSVRAACGFALLLLTTPAWAQATLRGVVVRDRERGAPMAGVKLSALGANPVTTGNDGQFVLTFRHGKPGQDVAVRARLAGWEVVNDVLLDRQLPDAANLQVFEVIVCVSAEREQRRMEFYRLKGNQAIERTYLKKLEELRARQSATTQERDRLLHERDEARKQVAEWARLGAARLPDEVGGAYKEALRLFLEGRTDVALQLLSDERLLQEVRKAEEQLRQVAAAWLLRGQLLATQSDYEGADGAYDKAVATAPAWMEAWAAYAYFHQQQNHFGQARSGYDEVLALARHASDDAGVAWALNSLGILSRNENRKAEARTHYEVALAIYQELARQNAGRYQPDIASTLNNLGVLSADENRKAEARRHYEKALVIYRELAHDKPDIYRPHVAAALNNLGILNREEAREAEARRHYEEALVIYRALADQSPNDYRAYVATLLNNIGILEREQNRKVEARQAFKEALTIYRELARQNPEVYQPYVANTLGDFGILGVREDCANEAREYYAEALAIYREFSQRAPATYQPRVEHIKQQLSEMHLMSRQHTTSCQSLGDCRCPS